MRLRAMLPLVLLGLGGASAYASAEPDDLMPGRSVTIRTGSVVKLAAKPASGTRFALPGVANHPTVGGGTLLLFDSAASGGGLMSLDLPHQIAPLGWRTLGDSTNPSGFQYRAAGTSSDPCTVTVKATGVKILCRGDGVTLARPWPVRSASCFRSGLGRSATARASAASPSRTRPAGSGGGPRPCPRRARRHPRAARPPRRP